MVDFVFFCFAVGEQKSGMFILDKLKPPDAYRSIACDGCVVFTTARAVSFIFILEATNNAAVMAMLGVGVLQLLSCHRLETSGVDQTQTCCP